MQLLKNISVCFILCGFFMACTGYVFASEQSPTPLTIQASFDKSTIHKQKIRVAYMPPAIEFNYYLDIGRGIKAIANATGNSVFTYAPQSDTPAIQVKMISEAIRQKVDAIILSTHNPSLVAAMVKKAVETGIIVVLVNTDSLSFSTPIHGVVGYSQRKGSYKLGKYVLNKMNPDNNLAVGVIEGEPGYHSEERVSGFLEAIKGSKLTVVASKNGKWNAAGGYRAAKEMFKKSPNIKLVFAANDFEIVGALGALNALNISDVVLLGIDGAPVALEHIYKGKLDATLYTNPIGMGETVMRVVLDIFKEKFTGGFVETPTLVVDRTNVDQYWQRPFAVIPANEHEIIAVSPRQESLAENSGTGLYWDILRAIYQPYGYSINAKTIPAKRASNMLRYKKADLMLGSLKGEIQGVLYPQWHYSANMVSAIYRKEKYPNWQGQVTLKNQSVEWVRGKEYQRYLYVPVIKSEISELSQGMARLQRNRIDFLIDNSINLHSIIKDKSATYLSIKIIKNDYKIQEILRIKQYFAFANTHRGFKLMKIFDERFPKLLESGKLRKIFEKWHIESFPFD